MMYYDPSGQSNASTPPCGTGASNNPDDTLVKQVSNEGGTYSKNNRLALGLSDYLDDFASENNLGMFELPFDIANDMSGEYYKPS